MMKCYIRIGISDKAKAVRKLPPIKIPRQKQATTGKMDVPENYSENLSLNPNKGT